MIWEIADEMASMLRSAYSTVDLDGGTVQVEPFPLANPTPPTIDMWPTGRDPSTAGFTDIDGALVYTVRARLGTADSAAAWRLLYAFLDEFNELGLAVVLVDEPTLNGLATSLDIDPPVGPGSFPYGDAGELVGYTWQVTVIPAVS